MGLLAKSATRKRIQPAGGTVNSALLRDKPWLTNGGIPASGLIRSAALAHGLAGVKSVVGRGHQSVLFAPRGDTSMWVETGDFTHWTLVVGAAMADGSIAADWTVELAVDTGAGTTTVATTQWLTTDGALAQGDFHDSLRNELLRALALGRPTENGSESATSAASLAIPQAFEQDPPGPFALDFHLTTALDETAVREQLRLVGHRTLDTSGPLLRWSLGVPANQDRDHVSIATAPGRLDVRARVESARPTERRIAAQALRNFVRRAYVVISNRDDSAQYHGPREWQP
jgi:hypothetical protein